MFLVENDQIGLSPILPSDRIRFFYLQQDPDINRYIRVPEPDEMVETFFYDTDQSLGSARAFMAWFGAQRKKFSDLVRFGFLSL